MGTSDNARGRTTRRQRVRNFDLCRLELAISEMHKCFRLAHLGYADADAGAEAFAGLVETITKGNQPFKNKILRSWGIRR